MQKTTRWSRGWKVLALGVLCAGVLVSGLPQTALAARSSETNVRRAYRKFMRAFSKMERDFRRSDTFDIDEAHKVGAYDLITAFLNNAGRQGLSTSGNGRRNYPRFAGFDDPDTRIGIDNPDTHYMGTVVDNSAGDKIYRVWGNRSNSTDFILTLFDTKTGTGGLGTLEDEDMVIAPDGSYEVYFSSAALRDLAWDNWVPLPAISGIQIARRHSACDWSTEVPGPVHIERVGSEGVPSDDPQLDVLHQQYEDATAIVETQGPFWPAFAALLKDNVAANFATPWQPTAQLGITTQLNMTMWFDLEDDEALILRLPDEGLSVYYGLEITNFWGSSVDWANRHGSLSWGRGGTCQAEQSAPTPHPQQGLITLLGGPACGVQDAYYAVISKTDPGVRNWIDTSGLTEGVIAARLQGVDPALTGGVTGIASCSLPTGTVVPLADVQSELTALGATFTTYGPAARAMQLMERQNFVREKYIFW